MLIVENTIIPAQWYPARATTGERRLLLAILRQAIDDYMRYAACLGSTRGQRLYCDILRWFCVEERHFGSFTFCCEHLGLDPDRIRRSLAGDRLRKRGPQWARP